MPRFRTTRSTSTSAAGREGPHFRPAPHPTSDPSGQTSSRARSPDGLLLPAGVRWTLSPQCAAACGMQSTAERPFDALALAEWIARAEVEIVKHGPHRTVYRLQNHTAAVYLKHYRTNRAFDALKRLFRPGAAEREWRALDELARRRVPGPRALAWGERVAGPLAFDSLLVTAELPRTRSLEEVASVDLPRFPAEQRTLAARRLLEITARFCASIHRAGVAHRDFHDANVLADVEAIERQLAAGPTARSPGPTAPDESLLYLVDVPGCGFTAPLDWPRSCRNLAMLGGEWRETLSLGERCRFLRAYLAARPDLMNVSFRQAAVSLDAATRQHARRTIRGRDKRSLCDNRDFRRVAAQRMTGHAVSALDGGELLRLASLAEHASSRQPPAVQQVFSATALVDGRETAVELHAIVGRRSFWSPGRPARRAALDAWTVGHALGQRGIPAPRPLCACWRRQRFSAGQAFVVYERCPAIPAACMLDNIGRRREAFAAAGGLLGRMHSWGVRVERWSLAMLAFDDRTSPPVACLAQLAGVRLSGAKSTDTRTSELVQLLRAARATTGVSRNDCLRFLRAYCRALDERQANWKQCWRAVSTFPTPPSFPSLSES